jgi:predicted ATPase/class 3 adenylate cyclase
MTFQETLTHVITWLQHEQRVSYRALKRQCALDDAYLEDLKDELIYAKKLAMDEDGRVLVWTGGVASTSPPAVTEGAQPALVYTPPMTPPAYLAEKILASRPSLEGERKQVTVLFADLKGSMELLAERDPEDARRLLDPALHVMMAAVHRYEGTVNQVMGDGIMALFGAPLAHEDHAVRACYAALAMQEAMQRYAEEVRRMHGVPIHMRVGLNAGEVVVRSIGSDLHMDYTAVGQTTHLAARMEQMAMPGSILITPAVLGLVEGFVQVKALGAMPVRGLRDPVEVYEVTGAGVVRSRLQAAAARGLTRFVGRQHELETVQQALAQAQAGQGQVAALVGEAGVGKSRLVYEVVHSHRTQGWLVLASASVSYGKATPYFPLIDLLKRYCHVEERDDPRTIRAKVAGQLLTLDETLHGTLPAMLALLDALPADSPFLTLDPLQRRQRTLDGLKRLLLRESQEQPLLLVCEDLHWIDTETQALLDSLVESLPTARLLLLVNYRPEYQHGWGSKTYYRQLRLDPLPPASANEFLQALLGNDASLQPLTQLLIARTESNPFFLEESVRTLVETGGLIGEHGAYRLAHPLEGFQVPTTVQAVLAARIDRLPAEEKRLLQTAAVLGTEVLVALLHTIADVPEAVLLRHLSALQSAEFLYETRLFPEHEYTFKHALTHEVAYSSLLLERRRGLHARLVETLEALAGEGGTLSCAPSAVADAGNGLCPAPTQSRQRLAEQVERLAHHALRGEVWDKALTYCRQAGEKAMARSVHREAVGYLEQALRALSHLPETRATREQAIDLRLALRTALTPMGDVGRTLTYLREAEALAIALDDRRRLGRVSDFLSFHHHFMGDHDQASAAAQRALALATTSRDGVLQAQANEHLGIASQTQGDYRRAIAYFGQTVASFDGTRHRERFGNVFLPAVLSRAYLAICHAELGAFAAGRTCGEEGLQIAEAVAHPGSLVRAYWGLGVLALRQGDLFMALPRLERAVGLCQDADLPNLFVRMAAPLGAAYTLAGRVADAVPLLTQAMAQTTTTERLDVQNICRLPLGEAQLLAGLLEEAQTLVEQALLFAREHQERGNQAYALRLLGDIAARCDPSAGSPAEAHYNQALTLADELGMRPLQAHCHRGLGTLYRQMGRSTESRAALSTAIALYRAMGMTFWLPQAEATLAQVGSAS